MHKQAFLDRSALFFSLFSFSPSHPTQGKKRGIIIRGRFVEMPAPLYFFPSPPPFHQYSSKDELKAAPLTFFVKDSGSRVRELCSISSQGRGGKGMMSGVRPSSFFFFFFFFFFLPPSSPRCFLGARWRAKRDGPSLFLLLFSSLSPPGDRFPSFKRREKCRRGDFLLFFFFLSLFFPFPFRAGQEKKIL